MAARSDLKWSELKVGLTVAVAAVVLILVIFALTSGSGWFTPKIKLLTYVDDAGGMLPGAAVNLEGVTIGNVTGVQLAQHPPNEKTPVEVTMSVTRGHERWLKTDSQVMLGTNGPLGETLVNIAAGTPQAPPATDGTVLRGQPSTGINDILISTHSVISNASLLEDRLGQILDQLQTGKGSIGKLLSSSELYDRFNGIALNLQNISGGLAQGQGTMGKLLTTDETYTKLNATLDNLNHLMDQMQTGQGSVAKLINDPSLYNNANQLIASVKATADNLNAGKGAIGALLTNSPSSQKLEDTLARLNTMLADLQAGKGTAGKLLNDPALYNNLNNVTTETQSLLQAIRTNPKKYLTIRLKIF